MKLMIEPTSTITDINGVKCRVWEGETDKGTPVTCFIAMVASPAAQDQDELQRELDLVEPKEPLDSWPTRMVLDNFD